jgi:hypothetical protein
MKINVGLFEEPGGGGRRKGESHRGMKMFKGNYIYKKRINEPTKTVKTKT